ncbi:hypothetical protein AJ79_08129 [Helicocarpus griseus UAMH5409]|uniref:Mid2 domain-containing protein n=1 Tax=Helicocarpus griseus UAMH5409 TaxID=1447875 RepID=A0A2B7WVT1_9EURO|nr:hypothetical protein AJ79_08129 [Helicocarpus griseus UAMH5409]
MHLLSLTSFLPFFPLLLLLLTSPVTAQKKCYLPNGEVEENDAPCFPQNPHSACCGGSTYVCSTNNMCAHYDGSYYVIGSCTDPTWNDPACPSYCYFRDHIHNSVRRCSKDTYCCSDGPKCNCTTEVNTQKILDFLPPYAELVGSSVSLDTAVKTTTLMTPLGAKPPNTKTASTTTTSAFSSNSASATKSPDQAADTGDSTGAGPTSANQSPSTGAPLPGQDKEDPAAKDGSGGGNNDLGMKVGLGVGIPLGVIALLLAALLYRVWRRGVVRNEAGHAGGGGGAGGVGAGYYGKPDPVEAEGSPMVPILHHTAPRPLSEAPDTSIDYGNNRRGSEMHSYYKPPVVHEVP